MGHALDVEIFAIYGGVVKLKITRENNDTNRGGNRQGKTICDRMGIADEFNLKMLTNRNHIAGADGLKLGAIHNSSFLHLSRQH